MVAHRGACREARENTIEAFRIARALGADGVELDVRRTGDGALIVHHDATAGDFGVLAERSFARLRADLPYVPTLEEALDELDGMLVNVEIKNFPGDPDFDQDHRVVDAVVEMLQSRSDRVIVSSFNLGSLDHLRRLDPTIATGWLTIVGLDPLDALPLAAERGHRALHPDVRAMVGPVASAAVERAGELGLAINVWTVDDENELRRLAVAGVDAVITNVPGVAVRILGP